MKSYFTYLFSSSLGFIIKCENNPMRILEQNDFYRPFYK